MHEHILAAIVAHDEAEALLRVEEFDGAGPFADDLRGHAATAATAAAETAAAATAAEATAAAAAITETAAAEAAAAIIEAAAETAAITTAARTAETTAELGISLELRVSETVPLVLAAPAASSIETHTLLVTFTRPS